MLVCGQPRGEAAPPHDDPHEQRRRILYPARFRGSALDKRLDRPRALQGDEAVALRRDILDGRSLLHAWQDAIAQRQPDVLRALLLLCDERDIRQILARPLYGSPLQQALPLADHGLAELIKQYPYQSPRNTPGGEPFPPQAYNVGMPFQGGDPANVISCRHFATHLLRQMQADPALKFDYHRHFSDPDRIRSSITSQVESQYRDWRINSRETHLISIAQFGPFVASQFAAMAAARQTGRLVLMMSTEHAMAFALRIKQKGQQRWHVVKFYDPNQTTHHARSKARDDATFASHSLASYVADARMLHMYFPDPNGIALLLVQSQEAASAGAPANRVLTSRIADDEIDAAAMHHLLSDGFGGTLRQLRPALEQLARLSSDTCHHMLAARNRSGISGLYMALQNGHADAVRAFGSLLSLLTEPDRNRFLIETIVRDGALPIAMQTGQAEAITALGELLATAEPETRSAVAMGRNLHGIHGLLLAAICGQAAAIRAFGVLFEHVPVPYRAGFLAMTDPDGDTGFHTATMLGFPEVLLAYRQLLEKVPPDQRLLPLSVSDQDGITAFEMALDKGEPAILDAWEQLLRLVPDDDAVRLVVRPDRAAPSRPPER